LTNKALYTILQTHRLFWRGQNLFDIRHYLQGHMELSSPQLHPDKNPATVTTTAEASTDRLIGLTETKGVPEPHHKPPSHSKQIVRMALSWRS
jgi:hypothetical protein